jgi:hypothetical protein
MYSSVIFKKEIFILCADRLAISYRIDLLIEKQHFLSTRMIEVLALVL